MKLTPLANLSRPSEAQLRAWQALSVPPGLAFVLDRLWTSRPVFWFGAPPGATEMLNGLWLALVEVRTPAALEAWTASVRQAVWGTRDTWPVFQERDGVTEYRAAWARASFLLGPPVLEWVADNAWRQAAERVEDSGLGYDRLLLRASRHARQRLAGMPSHPEPEGGWSVARTTARASDLAARFGFHSVRSAAGMPMADVWSALLEAERGLTAMAAALGWKDRELGARRLGLAFELDLDTNTSGYFDPLTTTLNAGRVGGYGNFAHEWAHALDQAIGTTWRPRSAGIKAFASWRAEAPYAGVFPEWQAEQEAWKGRDTVPQCRGEAMLRLSSAAALLPGMLARLRAEVPRRQPAQDGGHVFAQQVEELVATGRELARTIVHGENDPQAWMTSWDHWRAKARSLEHQALPQAERRWLAEWDRSLDAAERVLWGKWPRTSLWRVWSDARDDVDGREHWGLPQEAFARMVHAIVHAQVGCNTWAADDPSPVELFPAGREFEEVKAWWNANKEAMRIHWLTPSRDHAIWYRAMQASYIVAQPEAAVAQAG